MKLLFSLLLCASAFAQTPIANVNQCPTIIIGSGGGVVSNSGQTNTAEGWISGLLHLGSCNYIGTNVDMATVNGVAANTIRAEYSHLFPFGKLSDGSAQFLVGPVISAGTATVAPVIGSFAGGLYAGWNLGSLKKSLSGVMLTGEIRLTGTTQTVGTSTVVNGGVTTVTTTTVTPTSQAGQVTVGLYLGVSYSFH